MFTPKRSHLGATVLLLSTALTVALPKAANALSFSVAPAGTTAAPTSWGGITNTIIDFSNNPSFPGLTDQNLPIGTAIPIASSPTNGDATLTETVDPAALVSTSPLFTSGGRYLKVGGTTTNDNGAGAVRLDFNAAKGLGYFGFYWDSPSVNDRITFTLRDVTGSGTTTQTFIAAQIFAGLGYDFTATNQNYAGRYVNFYVTSTEPQTIASVLLEDLGTANNRSFEIDNIAYHQIPTPALLPGIVGLGLSFWNKRRKAAAL